MSIHTFEAEHDTSSVCVWVTYHPTQERPAPAPNVFIEYGEDGLPYIRVPGLDGHISAIDVPLEELGKALDHAYETGAGDIAGRLSAIIDGFGIQHGLSIIPQLQTLGVVEYDPQRRRDANPFNVVEDIAAISRALDYAEGIPQQEITTALFSLHAQDLLSLFSAFLPGDGV